MDVLSVIKNDVIYSKKGNNLYSFILDNRKRPLWSKRLDRGINRSEDGLQMELRYENNKRSVENPSIKRFFEYVSENDGIIVDLASGPSGYFSPLLDGLNENRVLIVTDACRAVLNAHSAACSNPNFYVFDVDLDKGLPFKDDSITSFSGNLLCNVINYKELLKEAFRCLKPNGRLAVIELFFDQDSKTFRHLNKKGAIYASFETYVNIGKEIGFTYVDSEILQSFKGKLDPKDELPLDENDGSSMRIIYFYK